MKAYTDLSQSKTLAEILPLDSADMGWNVFVDDTTRILPINDWDCVKDGDGGVKFYHAWSASALLEVIRKSGRYELQMYEGGYYFEANGFMTDSYLNPIDACYEMIRKLKERGLLNVQ